MCIARTYKILPSKIRELGELGNEGRKEGEFTLYWKKCKAQAGS